MNVFVVDASVVIKWFIPEIHSAAARRLLEYEHHYFAPDLVFAETANAIWKKVRRGELSAGLGQRLVTDLGTIAVETIPCRTLANDAYALAMTTGHSVYDALYLALAVRLNTRMITADERLARTLGAMRDVAPHVQTIQDFRGQYCVGTSRSAHRSPGRASVA